MSSQCGSTGGRRRRQSKKTRRTRSRRFRGGEFPSFQGAVLGANGQPAGAMSSGYTVSTGAAVPSSYEPVSGGRRRSRRGRKSRRSRHRMRGGTGGMGVGYGFTGDTIAGTKPVWSLSPTTTHETNAAGYNSGF
jgi:hypothetical protein